MALGTDIIPNAQAVMARVETGEPEAVQHFNHYINALARSLALGD